MYGLSSGSSSDSEPYVPQRVPVAKKPAASKKLRQKDVVDAAVRMDAGTPPYIAAQNTNLSPIQTAQVAAVVSAGVTPAKIRQALDAGATLGEIVNAVTKPRRIRTKECKKRGSITYTFNPDTGKCERDAGQASPKRTKKNAQQVAAAASGIAAGQPLAQVALSTSLPLRDVEAVSAALDAGIGTPTIVQAVEAGATTAQIAKVATPRTTKKKYTEIPPDCRHGDFYDKGGNYVCRKSKPTPCKEAGHIRDKKPPWHCKPDLSQLADRAAAAVQNLPVDASKQEVAAAVARAITPLKTQSSTKVRSPGARKLAARNKTKKFLENLHGTIAPKESSSPLLTEAFKQRVKYLMAQDGLDFFQAAARLKEQDKQAEAATKEAERAAAKEAARAAKEAEQALKKKAKELERKAKEKLVFENEGGLEPEDGSFVDSDEEENDDDDNGDDYDLFDFDEDQESIDDDDEDYVQPYFPGTNDLIPDEDLKKYTEIEWKYPDGRVLQKEEVEKLTKIGIEEDQKARELIKNAAKNREKKTEKDLPTTGETIVDAMVKKLSKKEYFVPGDSVTVKNMFNEFDNSFALVTIRKPDGQVRYKLKAVEADMSDPLYASPTNPQVTEFGPRSTNPNGPIHVLGTYKRKPKPDPIDAPPPVTSSFDVPAATSLAVPAPVTSSFGVPAATSFAVPAATSFGAPAAPKPFDLIDAHEKQAFRTGRRSVRDGETLEQALQRHQRGVDKGYKLSKELKGYVLELMAQRDAATI
jgi:hypothetical protein